MDAKQYDRLPQYVKDALGTFDDNQDLYAECERLKTLLISIGWSCDYDLAGEITEVTPIKK